MATKDDNLSHFNRRLVLINQDRNIWLKRLIPHFTNEEKSALRMVKLPSGFALYGNDDDILVSGMTAADATLLVEGLRIGASSLGGLR